MNKVLIIVVVVMLLLIVLYVLGKKSVHHEVMIDATPEQVWSVLTDTDKYEEWNPVMKLLEGQVKEGSKVKYQFTQEADNAYDINSSVKKVVPRKLLNQGGGVPLVLTFDHRYILEPSGNGTRLTIHEDYGGVGVNFWNPKPVQAAYKRLNLAIKKRAEKKQ